MLRDHFIEELNNAFDKRSWHGANLLGALRGVTPAQAARRIGNRKTIWEQLLHAAYWKHRVLRILGFKQPFPRRGSNWPAMPAKLNAAAWKADVEMLRGLHASLIAIIGKCSDASLTPRKRWLLHGAAAHDLYHAGQIKLLRRLVTSK